MTIADRISELRCRDGLSQEELAEKAGVSRQAVSKWESNQSVPDVFNIVLLAEIFGVTTDYIINGVESQTAVPRVSLRLSARYTIAATGLNFLGLLVSSWIYAFYQTPAATLTGFVLIVLGVMTFMLGTLAVSPHEKSAYFFGFLRVNIWIIGFFVASVLYNFLLGLPLAPYPIFGPSVVRNGDSLWLNGRYITRERWDYLRTVAPALFIVFYTPICAAATYVFTVLSKRSKREKNKNLPAEAEEQA